ncbi:MAG: glycosyltransferase family 87 protein, partial [Solirubrobacteraceae bacterium]
ELRRAAQRLLEALSTRRAGSLALAFTLIATVAIVAVAAGGPSVLVPRAYETFPAWEAGPLHLLGLRPILNPVGLGRAFSGVLVAMLLAYGVTLLAVRSLSTRAIVAVVIAVNLIVLLSPPMQLTDLFNYLGYARLGALHHLNPYGHVIQQEAFDPVSTFASWHNLRSPYGWLFTALTYPLAFVSLPIAYWAVKIVTVAISLAFVALVADCARRLGRDPKVAVAFTALNPIYIVYAVGGFHNDFFMLTPMLGSISLLLARRYRWAGAVLMLGVATKFTAVLLLPFLVLAASERRRQRDVVLGAVAATVPLAVLSLALFGPSLPNLAQQSSVLTGTSIPNLFGVLAGIGGATPLLLKLAEVGVAAVVTHQLLRNRDWIAGAGWSTLALIASLGWLMPWYVVWLLPLAAIGTNLRLRRLALVLTVFLVLAFVPTVSQWMSSNGVQLLNTPSGRAALSLQYKLSN